MSELLLRVINGELTTEEMEMIVRRQAKENNTEFVVSDLLLFSQSESSQKEHSQNDT